MADEYVDLRPYKPKEKKKVDESATQLPPETDFLSSLATAASSPSSSSLPASAKSDVIEILNLLNEKLTAIEDRLYRIERKLEEARVD